MTCDAFGSKNSTERVGILVAQLGTPAAPTAAALRPYLKQFLSDPRVIETNRALWWLILNGIVLRTRPKRSARLYARIWQADGSPLMVITRRQTEALRTKFESYGDLVHVEFGMRYGAPSIDQAIDALLAKGCRRLIVLPMYPQYSATTTASTYDAVLRRILKERWVPSLRIVEPYYQDDRYIKALAASINDGLAGLGFEPERIVLSYHGIPAKYVQRGDPYCCMCTATTELFRPLINFPADKIIHTYQSRFGRDPWLEPYTDKTIERLAGEGVKRLAVTCPGFTADCLETLDEIGNEAREAFIHGGGEALKLIPSVNDHPAFIDALAAILTDSLFGWIGEPQRVTKKLSSYQCPMAAATGRAACSRS